ncbi:aquaporin Z [Chryseobacterium piscicola]|uniref:Aquaporin Z n=1 Tax=Chryseobacterium piscicola TaxID=551459 RepID=A0A1N7MC84_9FLAO|nr:aquaporin Z [Chryseobacterium piscicola]PQA98110.1 aquaporin Z [Chryseobacterium piscicola]SIS83652.1 aquaporin Z [Chryseobacterium piscicola]
MISNTSKFVAEMIGTMVLVLMGCGSAVIAGADGTTGVGLLGISFAFGLSVVAMAYAIGHISGCHINPAISIAMVAAGRMKMSEAVVYILAQIIGAILGAGILYLIFTNHPGAAMGPWALGSNGWGTGYLDQYNMTAAFVAEFIFTFIFLMVILGSTSTKNINGGFAGLAIGLALVLIHIVGIKITGVSVNPARSIGPAIFAGGQALSQLWLFVAAPVLGGIAAAFTYNLLIERPERA